MLSQCGIRKDSRKINGELADDKRTAFEIFQFLLLLAAKVTIFFDTLTNPKRFRALVLDDSVVARKRSKKVELLAFNMLSSAKQEKRFREIDSEIDRRTNGYKARIAAITQKPDAAITMIEEALSAGIPAEYILMDTWFTNEPFIKRILGCGLDVIGMLKNNRQMYQFNGGLYNLDSLASCFARMNTAGDILGSAVVRTRREGIPVKLVFVRNRNKRNEYIIILSTDCSLSDAEIIRRYGYRWSIECCFKVCKSLLKLGKEFQPVNYDTTVSSTALVFTRFIILEWLRRKNSDPHSLGEIFFLCYDDIRDIELTDALEQLVTIIAEGLANGTIQMDESVRKEVLNWYVSQPAFIRSICQNHMKGAGLLEEADTNLGGLSTVA